MDVVVVHWPADAERLERLRAARVPRLVVVQHGLPPASADDLEDWLRVPTGEVDIGVRLAALRERARRGTQAVSVDDRVLRIGARLVVLPPIQARLAAALVERMDTVVGRDTLSRRAWPEGAPAGRNVLDVHIAKLRRLLAGTSIDIRTVHRRGYLMRVVPAGEPARRVP